MGMFSHHVLYPFVLTRPAFLPHSLLQLSTSIVTLYRYCNPNLCQHSLLLLSPHPYKSPGVCLPSVCSSHSGCAGFVPSFCADCPARECNTATWLAGSSSQIWALHPALSYDHEFVYPVLVAQFLWNTKPVGCFSKLGVNVDVSVLISNLSVLCLSF